MSATIVTPGSWPSSRRIASNRGVAQTHGGRTAAAFYVAEEAVLEATVGNKVEALRRGKAALAISDGIDTEIAAAPAFARAGGLDRAASIADEIEKRFPLDTFHSKVDVPLIRALVEIQRGNAARAVSLLQKASPYELGEMVELTPAYIRGEAYLKMRDGKNAEQEFQKIIDHRGVDPFDFPLAKLGLARAFVLQGDTVKARDKYDDFAGGNYGSECGRSGRPFRRTGPRTVE